MTDPGRSAGVNSKRYWDDRFASNWETLGGPEQSRVFMEAAVKLLPAAIYEEILAQNLSILDCGCAEADGTAVLARAFPHSRVSGFDFSSIAIERARARFPALDLFVSSFASLDRAADVLISSNCFEHLDAPVAALAHLASCARRYLILLVPFLERFPPDPEHVRIVHPATFPERTDGWVLTYRILVPPLPVWSQHQLLLIYEPAARAATAAREEPLVLAAFVADLAEKVDALAAEAGSKAEAEAWWERLQRDLVARQEGLDIRWRRQEEELELLRQSMEQSQRRIEERLAKMGRLGAELELARRDAATAWQELELARRENDALRQDLEGAKAAAATAEAGVRQVLLERERLAAERQQLHARLATLDGSLAIRSVHRFWALLERLMPEGTLRRRLYRRLTRPVKKPAPSPSPPPLESGEPAGLAAARPDPRAELQLFEQAVREGGADTVAILFSGTMLREDEGQRPTQLALGLARRGIPVVFAYWRWTRDEPCPQDRWRERICQFPIDVAAADPEFLASRFRDCHRRIALFEFPHPALFEPLAALNASGWITVYDVLDDWEEFHRVGQALWYDESLERHFITATDAVFAINGTLAKRVQSLGGSLVQVVPNGFRPGIEVVRECRLLERGEVTLGYFGYLAGAWFDWDLVVRAAYRKPGWRFHLIGYGGGPEGMPVPGNVALHGRKPQKELASYAAAWDVAIVPFKPERLAAGADPIKIYEYLAMGLPVVTTGVNPPAGSEGLVARAEGLGPFLEAVARAARRRGEEDVAARKAYAAERTWDRRLDAILETISGRAQRIAEKQRLFDEVP